MDNKFCHELRDVALFHSEYMNGDFKIKATPVENGKFTLLIFCKPESDFGPDEKLNVNISFAFELNSTDIDYFKGQIETMKKEYQGLMEDTENRDIQAVDRMLLTNFLPTKVRFNYGENCYSATTTMKAYFWSVETAYLCVLTSGKITPSQDAELHVMGGYLGFTDTDQIDNFIKVVEEGAFNALNEK